MIDANALVIYCLWESLLDFLCLEANLQSRKNSKDELLSFY